LIQDLNDRGLDVPRWTSLPRIRTSLLCWTAEKLFCAIHSTCRLNLIAPDATLDAS
jgi:hypothetical protein